MENKLAIILAVLTCGGLFAFVFWPVTLKKAFQAIKAGPLHVYEPGYMAGYQFELRNHDVMIGYSKDDGHESVRLSFGTMRRLELELQDGQVIRKGGYEMSTPNPRLSLRKQEQVDEIMRRIHVAMKRRT